MTLLTLDSLSVSQKKVLVRLDLNVPMTQGQVDDFTRIDRSLETLHELINQSAKVIILSHFGRPLKRDDSSSLRQLVQPLSERLNKPVSFASDCIGPSAQQAVNALQEGDVLLLENLRYHAEEEENDLSFAQALADLGDIYVNDAFSCSHRAHASLAGICQFLPSVAGRALEREISTLTRILHHPKHPVMFIIGGSKISTKLELLSHLIDKGDYLAVGGGMANTFLAALGFSVGSSLVETNLIPMARQIMDDARQKKCHLILPEDVVVCDNIDCRSIERITPCAHILPHEKIADIGPKTVATITAVLQSCQTVLWNGPVGIFEHPPFHQGSVALAQAIATLTQDNKLLSVAGGGDTLACLAQAKCEHSFSYTSTAGGAFLEWLEGKKLPGIKALEDAAVSYRASSRMALS